MYKDENREQIDGMAGEEREAKAQRQAAK